MIEKEEIERQLAPNEMREDQEGQIERPNSQDEDSHSNTPTAVRSYEAEGNIEYLDKIKEWMQLGPERTRIPSLKSYNQNKLKEKTKEVNDIPTLIHIDNITETNNLAYAGARLVVELMEIKISQNNSSKRQPNQPPWKRHLEKQLTELRADLGKLNEKYRIQEKGLNQIIEGVKQKVKAKGHKIQRYRDRNKGYQQNKLFQTN